MTRGILLALAAAAALAGCAGGQTLDPETRAARLAQINLQLGIGYLQEGKTDIALDKLRRAVKADPDSPDAHLAVAVLYDRLGENEAAESHFRDALRLAPENASIATNFGNFLCRLDRVPEAEEQFRHAAENRGYETPEIAYTNAGLCMSRRGAPARAEEYLRQALTARPSFPPALLALAELSLAQGRADAARGLLNRYHDATEPGAQSLALAVRIERALGDTRAAANYAGLLRSRLPDSAEAREVSLGRTK